MLPTANRRSEQGRRYRLVEDVFDADRGATPVMRLALAVSAITIDLHALCRASVRRSEPDQSTRA